MPAAEREHAESSSWGEPAVWRGSVGVRLAGLAAALVAVAVVAVFAASRAEHGKSSATVDLPSLGGDLHSIFVSGGNLCVGGHSAVALSRDAGKTWPRVGSLDDAGAMGWAVTGATVLVGGHSGVFRSTDDGVSFGIVSGQGALGDVRALGRAGAVVCAASPDVGLLASTDGARSWRPRYSHVGPGFLGAILVDAAEPTRLAVLDMAYGVMESDGGDRTWWTPPVDPVGAMNLTRNPGDAHRPLVVGMHGGARTAGGGTTWSMDVLAAAAP